MMAQVSRRRIFMPSVSRAGLARRARRALQHCLAGRWTGTRETLRRVIRAFLKPHVRRTAFLARIASEFRFAGLVAGALIGGGASGAQAWPPIDLANLVSGNGGFVVIGIDQDDVCGRSVAPAGDMNGDGFADFVVGTHLAGLAGETYVVFGKPDGAAVQASAIAGGSGGFIAKAAEGEGAGYGVGGDGDVNGDGIPDVIVAAPFAHSGGVAGAGKAYVVFGKRDEAPVDLSEVEAGAGGFAILGNTYQRRASEAVGMAGDVNGDGLADLILGGPEGNGGGTNEAGESHVVFGKTDGLPVNLANIRAGQGGFVINGADNNDRSGRSAASAGDVNGDGLADLIVGAYRADPGGVLSAGESYVIFGKSNGAAVQLAAVMAGTGGFVINGVDADDRSGFSVSGAGDVNGDGMADLIVGALNAGESYVVFGKADGGSVQLSAVAAGIGGFVILGIDPMDDFGWSVASAGDVNGDSLFDVIVGAKRASPLERGWAGESYVVYGKTDGSPVDSEEVVAGAGGFALFGGYPSIFSGYSVSSAGDVNSDGLDDVIVGAPHGSLSGEHWTGECYVVFSPAAPPAVPPVGIPILASSRARTLPGDGPGGKIVPATELPFVRITLNFSDGDFGSAGDSASTEIVNVIRTDLGMGGLSPLSDVANVRWEIYTNRAGYESVEVTIKYTDAEINGIDETSLRIITAESASGPWTELITTLGPARNEAKATVSNLGLFALARAGTAPGGPPAAIEPDLFVRYE